jgi:hypothetical protein
MVFALSLVSREDWEWLERRAWYAGLTARVRAATEAVLARLPLRAAEPVDESSGPARTWSRIRLALREGTLVVLMLLAFSQLALENRAFPRWLKHEQPRPVRAAIGYLRWNQGWSMFAPEAPKDDMTIVVDAVTIDGRRIDPFNERGSAIADPSLREIPKRLDQDSFFCDYIVRIVGDGPLEDSLSEWIFAHHRRTRRAADRVVRFDAYVLEQDSPAPGQNEPTNQRSHVFMSRTADR